MTTDSNREAFEDGLRLEGTALERDAEYGYYLNIDIENHWQTWQAATAHNKEKLRGVRDIVETVLNNATFERPEIHRTPGKGIIATLNEMIGGE